MEATNSVILEIDTNENAHAANNSGRNYGNGTVSCYFYHFHYLFVEFTTRVETFEYRCPFKVYDKHQLDILSRNNTFLKSNVYSFFNLTFILTIFRHSFFIRVRDIRRLIRES